VPLDPPAEVLAAPQAPRDYTADLKKLLASSNICSKRWVFEQYDSMVQTNTVQGPGGEAGVMRIKGTNIGLAMALDGNSRWCYLDPKLGAMHAVAEAARKVACTGATPVAATNCLNFGNPEKPEIMAQLSAAIDGIGEACLALGTPITGGNVSLYNETRGEGIYPTPVIGIVGIIEDVTRAVPSHFSARDEFVLLWQPYSADWDDENDRYLNERTFGSSQFAASVLSELWGTPPGIFVEFDARVHAVLKILADRGLVSSMSDLSDGGLAVAVAEASFLAGIGARIEIGSLGHGGRNVITLFGESACSILITCPEASLEEVKGVVANARLGGLTGIGLTQGTSIEILRAGQSLVSAPISELKAAWSGTLQTLLTEVHA
jgi:phosphoribosylformylglycinamidine synthase